MTTSHLVWQLCFWVKRVLTDWKFSLQSRNLCIWLVSLEACSVSNQSDAWRLAKCPTNKMFGDWLSVQPIRCCETDSVSDQSGLVSNQSDAWRLTQCPTIQVSQQNFCHYQTVTSKISVKFVNIIPCMRRGKHIVMWFGCY